MDLRTSKSVYDRNKIFLISAETVFRLYRNGRHSAEMADITAEKENFTLSTLVSAETYRGEMFRLSVVH